MGLYVGIKYFTLRPILPDTSVLLHPQIWTNFVMYTKPKNCYKTCLISFAKRFVAQNTAGTLGFYNKNMCVIKYRYETTRYIDRFG